MSPHHAFLQKSIKDVSSALARGETSVLRLTNESLKLAKQHEKLNSFITVCHDEAVTRARELDQQLLQDNKTSCNPLFGIPISIKDNFCTKDVLTTCASKMLENFVPSYTATAVSRLTDAGCVAIGKTNLDEFAMGSSSITSHYGPTANYWGDVGNILDAKPKHLKPSQWYMAGGSSTGSAVSVSSGACFASLGTDTGGSTRQPASLTGCVGFKPTYGLISRFGLIPLAHYLDVVSILARSTADAELVFNAVVGQDPNDMTSVDHRKVLKKSSKLQQLKEDTTGRATETLRIGVPRDLIVRGNITDDVSTLFEKVLKHLATFVEPRFAKFELVDLHLPYSRLATECYTIISSAEIASNMSCYDGVKFGTSVDPKSIENFNRDSFYKANRDAGFGPEVKKRILLGNYFLQPENIEKYLRQARKLRQVIADEFRKSFDENKIDVIMMPSTPTTSTSHDHWLERQNDNNLFYEDYFLIPSNLANLPSISLPTGFSQQGLPTAIQLVCDKFNDLNLLAISKLFEKYVFKNM